MRFTFSKLHLDFMRSQYPQVSLQILTQRFNERFSLNVTASQIKSALNNHKISCGRPRGSLIQKAAQFPQVVIDYAQKNYALMTRPELTDAINIIFKTNYSVFQVKRQLTHHSIRGGITGHFEKGCKPWNTGTKGLVQPNSGNFKPGHQIRVRNAFGYEYSCSKQGYVMVKVRGTNPRTGGEGKYVYKHRHIWESHYGAIPKDKVVSIKDGNKLNCSDIENLELVNRETVALMNNAKIGKAPAELRPTIRALAKLQAAINSAELNR